ncbi:hypothetical protein MP638_001603 [Amoeboaphelidium occidentale]|nr:hypothetical protein MP638_001603 [Amoeboaphelidium occidentale]
MSSRRNSKEINGTHKRSKSSPVKPLSNNAKTLKRMKCYCCGKVLEHPEDLDEVRCRECHVDLKVEKEEDLIQILDISPQVTESEPLASFDELIKLLQEFHASYLTDQKMKLLKDVLSSTKELNSILGSSNIGSHLSHSPATNPHMLDFAKGQKLCMTIGQLPGDKLFYVVEALQICIYKPKLKIRRMNQSLYLFMILLLPIYYRPPYVMSKSEWDTPLNKFKRRLYYQIIRVIGLISHLDQPLHQLWIQWLVSVLSRQHFSVLVDSVNKLLSFHVNNMLKNQIDYHNEWELKCLARVMSMFLRANVDRFYVRGANECVPANEFYNLKLDSFPIFTDYDLFQKEVECNGLTGKFYFSQYPFLISLGVRIDLLRSECMKQQTKKIKEVYQNPDLVELRKTLPFNVLRINRGQVLKDTVTQILRIPETDLRKQVRIEFVGEEGMDNGGLAKEWMMLVVRELFSPDFGLFVGGGSTKKNELNHPAAEETTNNFVWFQVNDDTTLLQDYYAVGVILGIAVYHGILVGISFPQVFYKKLLDRPAGYLNDLFDFQEDLMRSLRIMLEYQKDDFETVFSRDFVATYKLFGQLIEVELVPNGKNIPVTLENKVLYVEKYLNWLMNNSIKKQFEELKRGFMAVVGGPSLFLFQPEELDQVLRGSPVLDLENLQAITSYEGFTNDEPVVQSFWEIWKSWDPTRQRRLLTFVTGSDRVPPNGMAAMKFKITNAGPDSNRCPVSHTCFNQLMLYRYATRQKLEFYLNKAVEGAEGFGLK